MEVLPPIYKGDPKWDYVDLGGGREYGGKGVVNRRVVGLATKYLGEKNIWNFETDRSTRERANAVMEQYYLCHFCNDHQDNWAELLFSARSLLLHM